MGQAALQEHGRHDDILDAAQAIFSHYGYRRASLEEIAREAGISRTGLYHHFGNKEEVFRAMAERFYGRGIAAAALEAAREGTTADRLLGVLKAKMGWFFTHLVDTRHGLEIMDQGNRLCGDIIAAGGERYQSLIADLLSEADRDGRLDLRAGGFTPDSAASFVFHCAWGLQGQPGRMVSAEEYERRLERLTRVVIVGFGGRADSPPAAFGEVS